jgi:hypothetical protein
LAISVPDAAEECSRKLVPFADEEKEVDLAVFYDLAYAHKVG